MNRILLQVRLPKELRDKIREKAKENGMSLNAYMIMLIKNDLKED